MALYLVTGGAGFIGQAIVRALLERGDRVRVLDDFSVGRYENLAGLDVDILKGDIVDPRIVHQAVGGVDGILHEAAQTSVPASIDDPAFNNSVNVDGTLNLLLAARDAGVQKFVLASSAAVYGDSPTLPKRENMTPEPLSPYAVSKLAGEHYCQTFTRSFGMDTISLRYFNVYGPRQDPNSAYAAAIPKFITRLLAQEPISIFGDGLQSRDFVFVEDVARANLLALDAPNAAGKVFNIATNRRVTLMELTSLLGSTLNQKVEPRFENPRAGDIPHSLADIEQAELYLGYRPLVELDEGLSRTFEWYRSQPKEASP